MKIDDATINLFQGVYARLLVDVDISKWLPDKILATLKAEDKSFGVNFFVGVTYEYLPKFCSFCKLIGHGVMDYRKRSHESGFHGKENFGERNFRSTTAQHRREDNITAGYRNL